MGTNIGCINDRCKAFHKQIKFKKDDNYCSKCGEKLVYVCVKCHKPTQGKEFNYCNECQAELDYKKEAEKEKIEQALEFAKKAVKAAPTVVYVMSDKKVQKFAKPAVDAIKKLPKGKEVAKLTKNALAAADSLINKK